MLSSFPLSMTSSELDLTGFLELGSLNEHVQGVFSTVMLLPHYY